MRISVVIFLSFFIFSQSMIAQKASGKSNTGQLDSVTIRSSMVITTKTDHGADWRPQVWAIVVGISKYQKTQIALKYADKDAQLYYDFLKSPSGGSVDKDHSILLLNEQATRANILKEINDKMNHAYEEDMVILYIAGHGQPDPVGDEFYFLSYDADPNNLIGTAVSLIDIRKSITRTRANKKVWIVDACHSGGAGLEVRGNTAYLTNKLILELAQAKGFAILSASSASEFSQEGEKWGGGHGVFTYNLVKGLSGEADKDNDGIITIREIEEYVKRMVVESTNAEQHPELKGNYENRLPMSVVK